MNKQVTEQNMFFIIFILILNIKLLLKAKMQLKVRFQYHYNTSTAYVAQCIVKYKLILEKMKQIQALARGMLLRKKLTFSSQVCKG